MYPSTKVSELDAVWFDGVSGMAVGAGNEVAIHRDGGWTTEYHPSFETLLSVIGDGRGGFVVLGDLGSLYRWDPARGVWDSLFDRALSVKLEAAQLVAAATPEAWATGGDRLWHFAGGTWSAINLPAAPAIDEVTTLGLVDQHLVLGARKNKAGFAFVYDLAASATTPAPSATAAASSRGGRCSPCAPRRFPAASSAPTWAPPPGTW